MNIFTSSVIWSNTAIFKSFFVLNPGVGYIHKGLGNGGATQEYIFEGRPNNGTILVAATDVDGANPESVPDVSLTQTLIGNPYPSAIDAFKFIADNSAVIEGTIYLWEQWAGSTHILKEYQGGYATLNNLAKLKAYQFSGISGGNSGTEDGTLTPTQYIPVGQSFVVEVLHNGNIEFNNSQRVFKRDDIGESVFFKTSSKAKKEASAKESNEDVMQKLHLKFHADIGFSREMVIGFSNFTSDGFDYSYDGKMNDVQNNDFYTVFEGNPMVTQAYAAIAPDKVVPITYKSSQQQLCTISVVSFEEFEAVQHVYLRDNYTGIYTDIRNTAYSFSSESGLFSDRFDIVFQPENLSAEDVIANNNIVIYYSNNSNLLYVNGLNSTSSNFTITNMLGQAVYTKTNLSSNTLQNGLLIDKLTTGVYIVSIKTETNQVIDKKIVIQQ